MDVLQNAKEWNSYSVILLNRKVKERTTNKFIVNQIDQHWAKRTLSSFFDSIPNGWYAEVIWCQNFKTPC